MIAIPWERSMIAIMDRSHRANCSLRIAIRDRSYTTKCCHQVVTAAMEWRNSPRLIRGQLAS